MEKSIALLFLSDYKTTNQLENYYLQDGGRITGVQTNDAPMKYLMSVARQDGSEIRKILCIVSNVVRTVQSAPSGQTAFEYFRSSVVEWAKSVGYADPESIEVIPLYYPDDNKHIGDRTDQLYRALTNEITRMDPYDSGINIYIDYTGGMRDVTFLMTVFTRYLEFRSIRCRRIVYSQYNRDKDNYLYDITFIYEMFQMINGVSQFISTGNASMLSDIYERTDSEDAKEVLAGLINFSNKMNLCRVDDIDEAMHSLISSIEKMEDLDNMSLDGLESEMFTTLLPVIRDKMGIGGSNTQSTAYPALIRWCVENNLLQQAITLYVEKMPEYYLSERILPFALRNWDETIPRSEWGTASSEETYKFYTLLYEDWSAIDMKRRNFVQVLESVDTSSIMEVKSKSVFKQLKNALNKVASGNPRYAKPIAKVIDLLREGNAQINNKRAVSFQLYDYETDQMRAKNIIALFNTMVQDQEKCFMPFFLSPDVKEFRRVKRELEQKGTYYKKYKAAERIRRNNLLTEDQQEYLSEIMFYYLAVKIIRNSLNHAGETSKDVSLPQVTELLTQKGYLGQDMFEPKNIRALIIGGLDVSVGR